MAVFDHGVLNIPLSKRGDIDAQIDRFKADQAREMKAAMRESAARFKAEKAEALDLIEKLTAEQVDKLAAEGKCQARSVRKRLRSLAGRKPSVVVTFLSKGGAA